MRHREVALLKLASSMLCSVDGCDKASNTRGMCRRHSYKLSRYGDPLKPCGGRDPISVTHPGLCKDLVDPKDSLLTKGSNKKVAWKCAAGHVYYSPVSNRALHQTGCNICKCVNVLVSGVNDLATKFPEIAKDADFDPSSVIAGTRRKLSWKCHKCGCCWKASGARRTYNKTGCPACAGVRVYPGVNDLATARPDLAKELVDKSLATKITACSSRVRPLWVCGKCSHIYRSRVSFRYQGVGCPKCFPGGGFRSSFTEAWVYLLHRDGQQKVGITGRIQRRIKTHAKNGWSCVDVKRVSPSDAQAIEAQCLYVLDQLDIPRGSKAFRDRFDGHSESWQTVDWWADSLDCFTRKLYSDVWDKVFSAS